MFYGTAAAFLAYHTERGRDVSSYDTATTEASLLIASEWIDGSFVDRFPGLKVGMREQEREWPRTPVLDRYGYAVSSDSVPIEIERATYEAALRDLQVPGSLQVDFEQSKYDSVSIDGAISVKYRNLDASTVQKNFPIIGHILDRLLAGYGAGLSPLSSGIVRV